METPDTSWPRINGVKEHKVGDECCDCHVCAIRKLIRVPPRPCAQDVVAEKLVERVYTDYMGPINSLSIGKTKYFETLLHKFSGYFMACFFHCKSKTAGMVRDMILQMENLVQVEVSMLSYRNCKTVKWVRLDSAGEYIEHKFQNWLKERGIMR